MFYPFDLFVFRRRFTKEHVCWSNFNSRLVWDVTHVLTMRLCLCELHTIFDLYNTAAHALITNEPAIFHLSGTCVMASFLSGNWAHTFCLNMTRECTFQQTPFIKALDVHIFINTNYFWWPFCCWTLYMQMIYRQRSHGLSISFRPTCKIVPKALYFMRGHPWKSSDQTQCNFSF